MRRLRTVGTAVFAHNTRLRPSGRAPETLNHIIIPAVTRSLHHHQRIKSLWWPHWQPSTTAPSNNNINSVCYTEKENNINRFPSFHHDFSLFFSTGKKKRNTRSIKAEDRFGRRREERPSRSEEMDEAEEGGRGGRGGGRSGSWRSIYHP